MFARRLPPCRALALAALVTLVPVPLATAPLRAQPASTPRLDPGLLAELRFRSVGPHRGGRVTAVAGHRRQPTTFYMGATGGGVWKLDTSADGFHSNFDFATCSQVIGDPW